MGYSANRNGVKRCKVFVLNLSFDSILLESNYITARPFGRNEPVVRASSPPVVAVHEFSTAGGTPALPRFTKFLPNLGLGSRFGTI